MITAEFDKFYLTNVYVPYSGLQLQNLPKRIKWNDAFEKYVKNLENKKPVIICGDINVAHTEIDLAYPQHNINEAGFTLTERKAMDSLLNIGFTDAFRALYSNQLGAFTFWQFGGNRREKNIGWRLDYFLVSNKIKERIINVIHETETTGSDHSPIVLYIEL